MTDGTIPRISEGAQSHTDGAELDNSVDGGVAPPQDRPDGEVSSFDATPGEQAASGIVLSEQGVATTALGNLPGSSEQAPPATQGAGGLVTRRRLLVGLGGAVGLGGIGYVVDRLFFSSGGNSSSSVSKNLPTTSAPGNTLSESPGSAGAQEAKPAPVRPGTIDLTTIPAKAGSMVFENDAIEIPVGVDPNTNPAGAMNAFLAQYSLYLYNVLKPGSDDENRLLQSITNQPEILEGLQEAKATYRGKVGSASKDVPEFWDTANDPVKYTTQADESGNLVITQTGGTLYFNNWFKQDDSHPWQNPAGHDPAKATIVRTFYVAFAPHYDKNGIWDVMGFSIH